jgi:hypothetical protein
MKKKLHSELAADDADLVAMFIEAAARNGSASDAADYREGSRQHDVAIAVRRELLRRGAGSQNRLLPLLQHENAWVRYWAAVAALPFAPVEAAPVLESLAQSRLSPPLTLNAGITLSEWRKGNLRFE